MGFTRFMLIYIFICRYGHTVIAWGDAIYLFGGRNDEAACNVLYRSGALFCFSYNLWKLHCQILKKTCHTFLDIVLQIWHKHIHLVKTQRYSSISTWIILYIQFPKFWAVENDGYKCFSFQYLETSRGREMDTAHVSLVTLSPSRTSFWFYLPLFRPLHVCIWGLRGDNWKVLHNIMDNI